MHFSIVSEKSPTLHSFRGRLISCRYEAKTTKTGNLGKTNIGAQPAYETCERVPRQPDPQRHAGSTAIPRALERGAETRLAVRGDYC